MTIWHAGNIARLRKISLISRISGRHGTTLVAIAAIDYRNGSRQLRLFAPFMEQPQTRRSESRLPLLLDLSIAIRLAWQNAVAQYAHFLFP
ncbi:MAG: hypothetical protein A3H93_05700 [Rhodocyclales bacterium RIFCSPLOWO2_02_FULL_63_24]|nr:MAG: hypothetical protein A3H93_05700 [Rhodocyclales bacterium RIFCSPLOWO2_02_FULL_63_24]